MTQNELTWVLLTDPIAASYVYQFKKLKSPYDKEAIDNFFHQYNDPQKRSKRYNYNCKVNNIQQALFYGFIWDNTTGTGYEWPHIYNHIEKFLKNGE